LFDEKGGLLRYALFDSSGCAVLNLALQEAVLLGDDVLKPQALYIALTRVADGETMRLFTLLNVASWQLQGQSQTTVFGDFDHADAARLAQVTGLSQFDFWPSFRRILELASEIAQYDQGRIGERHLFYGLLVSRTAAEWLRKVGVDEEQILERVIWD